MANSGSFKKGDGRKRKPKGAQNKVTGELKEMILKALAAAGGVKYLKAQATASPAAFLSLIGRVLPLQVSGDPNAPLIPTTVTLVITKVPGADCKP